MLSLLSPFFAVVGLFLLSFLHQSFRSPHQCSFYSIVLTLFTWAELLRSRSAKGVISAASARLAAQAASASEGELQWLRRRASSLEARLRGAAAARRRWGLREAELTETVEAQAAILASREGDEGAGEPAAVEFARATVATATELRQLLGEWELVLRSLV
eukprot:6193159-Pleurochrysis_carterae.AAC.1